jgi:hypothetical protein
MFLVREAFLPQYPPVLSLQHHTIGIHCHLLVEKVLDFWLILGWCTMFYLSDELKKGGGGILPLLPFAGLQTPLELSDFDLNAKSRLSGRNKTIYPETIRILQRFTG